MFGHECNKRKVNDLLDTCKLVFKNNTQSDDNPKGNKKKESLDDDKHENEISLDEEGDDDQQNNKSPLGESDENHTDQNENDGDDDKLDEVYENVSDKRGNHNLHHTASKENWSHRESAPAQNYEGHQSQELFH